MLFLLNFVTITVVAYAFFKLKQVGPIENKNTRIGGRRETAFGLEMRGSGEHDAQYQDPLTPRPALNALNAIAAQSGGGGGSARGVHWGDGEEKGGGDGGDGGAVDVVNPVDDTGALLEQHSKGYRPPRPLLAGERDGV